MSGSSAEDGLMALLEAMLSLAAREARRPKPPPVKPGGFPEEQFIDLTEDEKDEFACNICYQILKETMQCVNNHKFCHSCLLVWSTTGVYANRVRCPVCRTHGYYFRNSDMDDRIGSKKVKCHLDSCSWSGLCKYLQSHRHSTYGEPSSAASESSSTGVTSMPRLAQASPRLPHRGTARFVGTGLTTRDSPEISGPSSTQRPVTSRASNLSRASSVSTASQETVVEIPRRAGTQNHSNSSGPSQAVRRPPPVRNGSNNRITFNHTGPNRDANTGAGITRVSSQAAATNVSASSSNESVTNSVSGGFTPRPPSAPRDTSNAPNSRRLPRIINPPRPTGRRYQPPEALSLSQQTNNSSNNQVRSENLGEIRDRLQESRNRLDNLMHAFNGELDRNRAEMAEFQQERERQRREQLEEVRELGQRLGQVASELRRLLEQRRQFPSFSDDDNDDDYDDDDDE